MVLKYAWVMRKVSTAAIAVVLLAVSTSSYRAQGQSPTVRSEFVSGQILLKFRPQVANERAAAVLRQMGAVEERRIGELGVRVLRVPSNAEQAVSNALANRPEVEFAEPDRWVEPDRLPNDPEFPNQWHLTKISGPNAWDTTTGSSTVTIAILDTGVDGTHPDLATKIVPGWNFWNNNSDTSDVYGHGTAVAGAATATGDNFAGIASVSWNTRIMPIRISDAAGYSSYSIAADALVWAANHGARVANISYMFSNSSTVRSAAQYFQQKGGVVTISAGNNSAFDSTSDNPYVLTVSATNPYDTLTSWSNTGNNVDLSAPGESILTTANGGGYRWAAGTSFSAPIAAGVAALVLSVNPGLSATEVQDILKNSADDLGNPGKDPSFGYGRVNAASAVAMALADDDGDRSGNIDTTGPTISISSPAAGSIISGIAGIHVSASDDSGVASVRLDSPFSATDTTSPFEFSMDTRSLSNGTQVIMVSATDAVGNTATTSIIVTVQNVQDQESPVPYFVSLADGQTVSGNVMIETSAADNVGVTRMELWIDGKLKATSSSSNLTTRWNTRPASRGSHTLHVKAFDAAGNVGIRSITVVR